MRTILISWTIVINGQILEFKSLTSIDPVTNIAEFIRIESKTKPANMFQSKHVSEQTVSSQDIQDKIEIDIFMTTKENSLVMIFKRY